MEHLTGINIRTGLDELQLPVKEIFRIKTEEEGDSRIKELYDFGTKKTFSKYAELTDKIVNNHSIIFNDKKIAYPVTDNLTAYVYDSYIAYQSAKKGHKIYCEKMVEVEFVNFEFLDFDDYCYNFMAAQAFTGQYIPSVFPYPFIGIGNFELEEYANVHQMVVNSNCNMMYFFVYYQNVLSSIDKFITASYEDDIKSQKKHMQDADYSAAMKSLKNQKQIIANYLNSEDPIGGARFSGE